MNYVFRFSFLMVFCVLLYSCKNASEIEVIDGGLTVVPADDQTKDTTEAFGTSRYIAHVVDPAAGNLKLVWKDDRDSLYRNAGNLRDALAAQGKQLKFAANAGMYQVNRRPLGLFIEDGKQRNPLNTGTGNGNFHLKPNGVFYLTRDNKAHVVQTQKFKSGKHVQYATQSGPMLLIDGKVHPKINQGSANLNIRNGVGILPDGKVILAQSRGFTNFYDFAQFFKEAGCKNALFLDGAISRTYLPEQNWEQTDGNLGVLIAEIIEE